MARLAGHTLYIMKTKRIMAEIQIDVKAILNESEFPCLCILHVSTSDSVAPIQPWQVESVQYQVSVGGTLR